MQVNYEKARRYGRALKENQSGSIIHTQNGSYNFPKEALDNIEGIVSGIVGQGLITYDGYAIDVDKVVCIERVRVSKSDKGSAKADKETNAAVGV